MFNITRHWEVALYYATYQTERRLATNEPLLPLIVSGTTDDTDFVLDPDELADKSLQWPTLKQLETQEYDPDWLTFLERNFGTNTAEQLVFEYKDNLRNGQDPATAKKNATEKVFRTNPDAAKGAIHSVDPSFKDQFHVPVIEQNRLPVENVFLIQNDGSVVELTPENYIEEINNWRPYTEEELRDIKTHQDFSGVDEGFYPYATR